MPDGAAGSGHNSDVDIEYDELARLLDDLANKQKTVAEAAGSLRSALKSVLDDTGWHKGALGMIRQIDAMSESKRNDFLRTFEPLFEVMIAGKWRQEQEDLLSNLENEEPDAE